jgi:hypothetical protein
MLVEGELNDNLYNFLISIKDKEEAEQVNAIRNYTKNFEKIIYQCLKNITIKIPVGAIQVQGTPSNQSNISELILENVVN